ncbi:MAG: AAA family ATPase [Eubacteriales bacterium]|nr:AAA family ATPase [Eubacteriales bacterium]
MNIREVKEEITNALNAYHIKDEYGNYLYPVRQQRPILLMGPPGIGKTAIMEQIASECDVGLVSYTITHHTRQSAVGLPEIIQKSYHGESFSVTEYTMSEIVASVYECIERTGKTEGILFIDEINCVSETLTPTMLQFLQKKMFGSHKIPEGYLIVAAGNPIEYNRTAREFDIVTLDRVRCISIEPDLKCWMQYAANQGIHGAVLSYLRIRENDFYYIDLKEDKNIFVTARGWEDLSEMIAIYERMGYEITLQQVSQFIHEKEIAGSFTAYYRLYRKYQLDYSIVELMNSSLNEQAKRNLSKLADAALLEERMTVAGMILDTILQCFQKYHQTDAYVVNLYEKLIFLKGKLKAEDKDTLVKVEEFIKKQKEILKIKLDTGIIAEEQVRAERYAIAKLEEYFLYLKKEHIWNAEEIYVNLKSFFQKEVQKREQAVQTCSAYLERGIHAVDMLFGKGAELTMLLSEILDNAYAMDYICRFGSAVFLEFTSDLIGEEKGRELQQECRKYLVQSHKGEI